MGVDAWRGARAIEPPRVMPITSCSTCVLPLRAAGGIFGAVARVDAATARTSESRRDLPARFSFALLQPCGRDANVGLPAGRSGEKWNPDSTALHSSQL